MGNIIIDSKPNSMLRKNARPPIIEIEFVGSGGAFDFKEGNSSALIKTLKGNILIDCGSTTFSELLKTNNIKNIDIVLITHLHEDHIGSLSTLIHYNDIVLNKQTTIMCHNSLKDSLLYYLTEVGNNNSKSFKINDDVDDVFKNIGINIMQIDTTGYHYSINNCAYVFQFKKNKESYYIIYSGDINTPIFNVFEKDYNDLYSILKNKPNNVFIFHEATSITENKEHCYYKEIAPYSKVFNNLFVYHHSKEETKEIISDHYESVRKYEKIKNKIDKDYREITSGETDEAIKKQIKTKADLIKKEFKKELNVDDDYASLKDINQIGSQLVIQEAMGF